MHKYNDWRFSLDGLIFDLFLGKPYRMPKEHLALSALLTALRKKTYTDQTKLNPIHWGVKTRNERSVQETEQYLYCFLPLIRRTVQLSCTFTQQPAHRRRLALQRIADF